MSLQKFIYDCAFFLKIGVQTISACTDENYVHVGIYMRICKEKKAGFFGTLYYH
jgi:hypothetical protein